MSVATKTHWTSLEHTARAGGSSSGDSNSSSVMPASTSSSGNSSTEQPQKPTIHVAHSSPTTWTTGTFYFPPCTSRMMRSLPTPPLKLAPTTVPTSRMINSVPGFDELAELVISSERSVPRVTVTSSDSLSTPQTASSTSHTSPTSCTTLASPPKTHRSRRHSQRSAASEPKPMRPVLPAPSVSLPWSKDENDAGRVTFIFGRLKPPRAPHTAPPAASTSADSALTTTIFTRSNSPLGKPVLSAQRA